MSSQVSTYIIAREDLAVDPVTIVSDGLKIGRLPTCELVLNHPTVSRLHAGIKETGGRFYIYNFSHSSGTTLNGRLIPTEEADTLAGGDVLQIGPFLIYVDQREDALHLRVSMQVAVNLGEAEAVAGAEQRPPVPIAAAPAEVANALSIFWTKRKREEGKMQRKSPMRPQAPARVLGKARFNWTPTRDLVRPWPFAIFTWGLIVIGVLSAVSSYAYNAAFSPAPISDPHTRKQLTSNPPIADHPNGDSCLTCHTIKASMDSSCARCHQTQTFSATVIQPHTDAGITCMACHGEHRGREFSPAAYSLQTCGACHNNNNKNVYNGRRVGTPHNGTLGYPVSDGTWIWKGLRDDEWALKPVEMKKAIERWPTTNDDQRRSAQFHVIHLHRVKVPAGMPGNETGEMSCSSCHRAFAPIDRTTPRTTCASCHNGSAGRSERSTAIPIAADAPNCTSCHVQHIKSSRRWGGSLLADAPDDSRKAGEQTTIAAHETYSPR